jgi:hypothetical protein
MKKLLFRISLGAALFALALATLQILFDVPVLPFLVPQDGLPGIEITATYAAGVQRAEGEVTLAAYPSIIVQRGIPVEFTLTADAGNIDGCNEYLSFPDFGMYDVRLIPGANVIRFTPEESGVFYFNCHLKNMEGTVTVVENLGFVLTDEAPSAPTTRIRTWPASPEPTAPSVTASPEPTAESPEPEPTVEVPASPEPEPTTEAPASTPVPSETVAPVYEKPADSETDVGGWLEQQLLPSSGSEGVHEIRTWTGWIFDRDCVGISPVKHTKACNLMGGCYDSGLGIFEYVPGKEFDTYTAVDTFLCFDGASKELAAAFLRALPQDWKNNVTITVTGYAVNNIPASKDELLVPETDLARVDHYLNGIHITSITAAFIDGVSTNTLPDPNIAFSQP